MVVVAQRAELYSAETLQKVSIAFLGTCIGPCTECRVGKIEAEQKAQKTGVKQPE